MRIRILEPLFFVLFFFKFCILCQRSICVPRELGVLRSFSGICGAHRNSIIHRIPALLRRLGMMSKRDPRVVLPCHGMTFSECHSSNPSSTAPPFLLVYPEVYCYSRSLL